MAEYTAFPGDGSVDNIIEANLVIQANTSYTVLDFLEIADGIELEIQGLVGIL